MVRHGKVKWSMVIEPKIWAQKWPYQIGYQPDLPRCFLWTDFLENCTDSLLLKVEIGLLHTNLYQIRAHLSSETHFMEISFRVFAVWVANCLPCPRLKSVSQGKTSFHTQSARRHLAKLWVHQCLPFHEIFHWKEHLQVGTLVVRSFVLDQEVSTKFLDSFQYKVYNQT